MTEFISVPGGTLAYEADGEGTAGRPGPRHGRQPRGVLGSSSRDWSRRVLRGRGRSAGLRRGRARNGLPTRAPTSRGDLLAVIRHLGGGPAVLVGHSISGGAATVIAAAREPGLVWGIIELGPSPARSRSSSATSARRTTRQGAFRLLGAALFGSAGLWSRYLDHAYPGRKPDDWAERLARVEAMLGEPGRMQALREDGAVGAHRRRRPAGQRAVPRPDRGGLARPRLGRSARRGRGASWPRCPPVSGRSRVDRGSGPLPARASTPRRPCP